MAHKLPQNLRSKSKDILKALYDGVPFEEAVKDIYSPLVLTTRDGGYLVHKNADVTEKGTPISEYYSEEEFSKIRHYFKAIIFMCERDNYEE